MNERVAKAYFVVVHHREWWLYREEIRFTRLNFQNTVQKKEKVKKKKNEKKKERIIHKKNNELDDKFVWIHPKAASKLKTKAKKKTFCVCVVVSIFIKYKRCMEKRKRKKGKTQNKIETNHRQPLELRMRRNR